MKYLANSELKDIMIDNLKDKLEEYKGNSYYACDLASELYEVENADGYIFSYYHQDNIDFIKEHWWEFSEIIEELKYNYGAEELGNLMIDLFDNPCKFVCIMCLETARYLISQCDIVDKNWNRKIELTQKNIDIIKKQLEELRD